LSKRGDLIVSDFAAFVAKIRKTANGLSWNLIVGRLSKMYVHSPIKKKKQKKNN
jgi:hypothetical protein